MDALGANIGTLWENSGAVFLLAGILAVFAWGVCIRRIRLTSHMMVTIALMIAFTVLLSQVRIYHFPQGGSVTLGKMIPLLLLSRCYGAGVGMLGGFLYGLLLILQDPFILHPVQVLFDYPLPYMMVGLAGLFPARNIFVPTVIFFVGKFLCHFISGVAFFSSYAPEGMSPVLYSLTVNLSLQVPECIICCVILRFLPVKRLLAAMRGRNG